jgi:hypothetical protein
MVVSAGRARPCAGAPPRFMSPILRPARAVDKRFAEERNGGRPELADTTLACNVHRPDPFGVGRQSVSPFVDEVNPQWRSSPGLFVAARKPCRQLDETPRPPQGRNACTPVEDDCHTRRQLGVHRDGIFVATPTLSGNGALLSFCPSDPPTASPFRRADRLLALGKANCEAVLDGLGLEGRSLAGCLHARLPAPRDHVEPSAGHEGNDFRPLDRERIRHTGPWEDALQRLATAADS